MPAGMKKLEPRITRITRIKTNFLIRVIRVIRGSIDFFVSGQEGRRLKERRSNRRTKKARKRKPLAGLRNPAITYSRARRTTIGPGCLTAVFGKGTGVAIQVCSPEFFHAARQGRTGRAAAISIGSDKSRSLNEPTGVMQCLVLASDEWAKAYSPTAGADSPSGLM